MELSRGTAKVQKGKLKNVKVLRGVHKSLDRASLRLVKSTAGLSTAICPIGYI